MLTVLGPFLIYNLLRQAQWGRGTKKKVKQQIRKTTLCLCAFAPMNLSSYGICMKEKMQAPPTKGIRPGE